MLYPNRAGSLAVKNDSCDSTSECNVTGSDHGNKKDLNSNERLFLITKENESRENRGDSIRESDSEESQNNKRKQEFAFLSARVKRIKKFGFLRFICTQLLVASLLATGLYGLSKWQVKPAQTIVETVKTLVKLDYSESINKGVESVFTKLKN